MSNITTHVRMLTTTAGRPVSKPYGPQATVSKHLYGPGIPTEKPSVA